MFGGNGVILVAVNRDRQRIQHMKEIEIIRELITANNLQDALLQTEIFLKRDFEDSHWQSTFFQIKHEYSNLTDRLNNKIINYDEYNLYRNRIVHALLKLLDEMSTRNDIINSRELEEYKDKIAKSNIKELLEDLIKKTKGSSFETEVLMLSYRLNQIENDFFRIKDLEEELDSLKSQIDIINKKILVEKKHEPRGLLGLIAKIFFD